jgi:hypothetical protein
MDVDCLAGMAAFRFRRRWGGWRESYGELTSALRCQHFPIKGIGSFSALNADTSVKKGKGQWQRGEDNRAKIVRCSQPIRYEAREKGNEEEPAPHE